MLMKERQLEKLKVTEDEEEYVSRYWMTLKKREDTVN
jgi:hypothetical protein